MIRLSDQDPHLDRHILMLYAEKRDKEAFDALVETYLPLVRRSLTRRIRDYRGWWRLDLELEDCAHEVLLRLDRGFRQHEAPLSISRPRVWVWNAVTWTLESCVRTCAKRDRREVLTGDGTSHDGPGSGFPEGPPFPSSGHSDTDPVVTLTGKNEQLENCTQRLGERPREVVRLWALGTPYERIARSVGLAQGNNVARIVNKAIRFLRECMSRTSSQRQTPEAQIEGR